MKINANEMLLANKKFKLGDVEDAGKNTATTSSTQNSVTMGMNALTFQGMNNLMSNPALSQKLGVMNDNEPEQTKNSGEYFAPNKSDLAFKGKGSTVQTVLLGLMTMAAAGAMTSCSDWGRPDVIQTVDIDMSAIMQLATAITQMVDEQKTQNQAQQEFNTKMLAYMNTLISSVQEGNMSAKEFYAQMFEYMVKNDQNQELIITQLVQNGMTEAEAVKKIQELIDKVEKGTITAEQAWSTIQGLLSDIKDVLTVAVADFNKYYTQMLSKQDELITTTKEGFEEVIKTGNITNDKLDQIKEQGDSLIILNNQASEERQAIRDAIEKSNIDMNSNFETVVSTLNLNKDEMIAMLTKMGYTEAQIMKMTASQIIKAIDKNTEVTKQGNSLLVSISSKLDILPELLKEGKITNAQLKEFYNTFNEAVAANGEYSEEMLTKLEDLANKLDGIQDTLNTISETLTTINTNFNKFYGDYKKDKQSEFRMLGELIKDNKVQTKVLVDIKNTQTGMAENLAGIKANTDSLLVIANNDTRFEELINTIKNIDVTSVDGEKLEEMFKLLNMNLTDAIQTASKGVQSEIKSLQKNLQTAIKNFQNTYIATESKQIEELQTVNSKIDDLQIFLVNNLGNNTSDQTAIIDALNNLTEAVNAGNEDVTDELKAINSALDKLQASVDAILKELGTLSQKATAAWSSFETKFNAVLEQLGNIRSDLKSIITNQKVAALKLDNLTDAVNNLKAEIAKLQNLNGGSSISKEELEAMWKEHDADNYKKYAALLENLDLGGNDVNLTTVEDLLKAIDDKLAQQKDYSDILGQILDKINAMDTTQPDYNAKLDKIIEKLNDFKCNCECGNNNEGILKDIDTILG